MIQALKNGFWVMSEGETLILKKNLTEIHFDDKMMSNSGKWSQLTNNFYKSLNNDLYFGPQITEGIRTA